MSMDRYSSPKTLGQAGAKPSRSAQHFERVSDRPPSGRAVTIQNDGPIIVGLNHMVLSIQQARLQGPETTLECVRTGQS